MAVTPTRLGPVTRCVEDKNARMGASTSALKPEEISELQVSAKEIKLLYDRFTRLDRNKNGYLSSDEFQLIPELSMNPLCDRIISSFNNDDSDEINFKSFVTLLSIFTDKASLETKLKYAFQIYDVDGDGFVSKNDLYHILQDLVGTNLTDSQLERIVDKTIQEGDADKDGGFNFQEFCKVFGKEDVKQQLTIKFF